MRVGGLASRAGRWDVRLARLGPGNFRRRSACVGTRGGRVDRSRRWRRRHNARTPPPRARARRQHLLPDSTRTRGPAHAGRLRYPARPGRRAAKVFVGPPASSSSRVISAPAVGETCRRRSFISSHWRHPYSAARRGRIRCIRVGSAARLAGYRNASFALAAGIPAAAPPASPRAAGGPSDAGVGVGAATNAVRLLPRAGAAAAFAPPTARARVARRARARSAIEHVPLGEQQGNQSGLQLRRRPGMSVGVAARAFAADKATLDWQWQRIPGMGQPATSRPWGGCRQRPSATSHVIHSVAECTPLVSTMLAQDHF